MQRNSKKFVKNTLVSNFQVAILIGVALRWFTWVGPPVSYFPSSYPFTEFGIIVKWLIIFKQFSIITCQIRFPALKKKRFMVVDQSEGKKMLKINKKINYRLLIVNTKSRWASSQSCQFRSSAGRIELKFMVLEISQRKNSCYTL